MPETDLAGRLARLIERHGPISVAHYMAEANAHYYGTRDPLGAAGDFTTAPEISQMFGELVGFWLADLWLRARQPAGACYVELGPGRGTLAADALRAMGSAGLRPPVHFVETSPVLRRAQAERVPDAIWHDDAASLPDDAPLLVVANEFFDALPVRQLVATEQGWHERMVVHRDGRFHPVPGPRVSGEMVSPRDPAPGTIVETSPASTAVMGHLAGLITRSGGAALIVDYGHVRSGTGDTLQAVAAHQYADPWVSPGARDLTAHVDFEALGAAARAAGATLAGPVTQGAWLQAMGIEMRERRLAEAVPRQAEALASARRRLTDADQMGNLFKVLALTAPHWPQPAGFP